MARVSVHNSRAKTVRLEITASRPCPPSDTGIKLTYTVRVYSWCEFAWCADHGPWGDGRIKLTQAGESFRKYMVVRKRVAIRSTVRCSRGIPGSRNLFDGGWASE